MPKKDFIILLNETTRIFVFFENAGKIINRFVVKLEILINGKWIEIERYDIYHGFVHKDILDKNGEKIKTVEYRYLNNKAGFNVAIKDFKENYNFYIRRYYEKE